MGAIYIAQRLIMMTQKRWDALPAGDRPADKDVADEVISSLRQSYSILTTGGRNNAGNSSTEYDCFVAALGAAGWVTDRVLFSAEDWRQPAYEQRVLQSRRPWEDGEFTSHQDELWECEFDGCNFRGCYVACTAHEEMCDFAPEPDQSDGSGGSSEAGDDDFMRCDRCDENE